MNLRENYFNFYSTILILCTSFIFSYLLGSGFYGYGNDFYALYHKPNLNWGGIFDRLGYIISTFSYNDNHYGVHVVSFFLSISSGLLLKSFFQYKKKYSIIFFILIYLICLHTWPIIMSTSNAMRQGITMSLIFISISQLLKNKNIYSLFFIILSIFTHKSGIFFLFLMMSMIFLNSILNRIYKQNLKGIICFFYGIIILFLSFFFLINNINLDESHRIIAGDYRVPFFIINLSFILFFTYRYDLLVTNKVNLYLYLFSFLAPSLLILGLNWQYERLCMMMTIPYIFILNLIFNKRSFYLYLFLTLPLLLFLTIENGMYSSLY